MSGNARPDTNELTKLKITELKGEPIALANSDELLRLLECPVCTQIQLPPIFNCELGHSICYKCRQKTRKCPTCARPFTTARNYLAESIAETAKVTCGFKDEGCPVVTTVLDHVAHIKRCEYRPILCYVTKTAVCKGVEVDLSSYFPHLIGKHSIAGQELEYGQFCDKVERTSILNEGARWPPFYMKIEKNIFLKHTAYLKGNLYWWVVLVSARCEEAEEYESTIVASLGDMTFKYSVPVHHFRKSSDYVITSGKCASLPYTSVVPFCRREMDSGIDYGHCWDMKFSVSKKGKAAKREEPF